MTLINNKFVASDLPPRVNSFYDPCLCFVKAYGAIAVMGGGLSMYGVKNVELYHLQDERWSTLPDLNVGRAEASSCLHDGYIYIFGGET